MTAPMPEIPTVPPRSVAEGLDRVAARVRRLYLVAGGARIATGAGVALTLAYVADRTLHLPLIVRALLLAGLAVLLVREVGRRLWRPLRPGPGRLDAARLVERVRPEFEGRLISALQLGGGPEGSLPGEVARQAERILAGGDPAEVLDPRPCRREAWWTLGTAGLIAVLVAALDPALGVFARRWTLSDVPWPRDTHLQLQLPDRGPVHVVTDEGTIVAARGGVLDVRAEARGLVPDRVELVVDGARGERAVAMAAVDGVWRGHVPVLAGDRSITVRGGDDPGAEARRTVRVIDPPRLDEPRFVVSPPDYLGEAPRAVGAEELVVPEGSGIEVEGDVRGDAASAELWMLGTGEVQPLQVAPAEDGGMRVTGRFTAEATGSIAFVLTGPFGLSTPDPAHHALLVQPDRPPGLRVFAPPRSTIKVTDRAVVPFGVLAEDDHGVEAVTITFGDGAPATFARDAARPGHFRWLLDLADGAAGEGPAGEDGAAPAAAAPAGRPADYALLATDGRRLPGRGPQSARLDNRRLDVVETAEVQRLLADRQLRLKESYQAIRDRQRRVSEIVASLGAAPPGAAPLGGSDADLVASVVAQNQVTLRLRREARELATVVDETICNRLDSGPGAGAVLRRRLEQWMALPVDETFPVDAWRALSAEYAEGRFGRLDQVGRLLDMLGVALELSEQLSPAAHEQLLAARTDPSPGRLAAAAARQAEVEAALDRLLGRMDEWEDYQEVLTLVKSLIDDQQRLRARTEAALRAERETP